MVSGGWKSSPGSFRPWMGAALLRRGYTIFAVYHVSQPEATVMEIVDDVNRAVRYVRHNARQYGVDPLRLGVTGGSAGGHLSLMLATRGGPGPASAADPIDSESSAVQAVAIFYPVTDLLNLGKSTENLGDGGPPKSFVRGFGPNSTNLAVWKVIGREMSPIYYVTTNLPPTLIYHGDADTLVPLEQSERFQAEARKLGSTVELVVHHGGQHGWLSMVWDIRRFADWFDRYLAKPGT
jgi:acetyl esterase/lipase